MADDDAAMADIINVWLERDDLGFDLSDDDDLVRSPVSGYSSSSPAFHVNRRGMTRDAWEAQAPNARRRMNQRWHEHLPRMMPLTAEQIYSHKALVRRGIPSHLRPQIWSWACSVPVLAAKHPGEFRLLLDRAGVQAVPNVAQEQIEKDLKRTFPNHPFYRSEAGLDALRSSLTAFAMRNPHIGYSQSMNFVAGLLNLVFDPERAYWMLVAITERLLPRDFYDRSLLGCRIQIRVLRHLIRKMLPEVDAVLERHHVDIVVVCVGWWMPMFLNTLPIGTALRVWDCFLVEGDKVLFRVSLALLKLHASDLVGCRDANQIIRLLTRIGKGQYDADALIQMAFKKIGTLRRSSINKFRSQAREVEEQIERGQSDRRRTRPP